MSEQVGRREFLSRLGVTLGAASAASLAGTDVAGPRPAGAQPRSEGTIPGKPVRFGHMTFLSGPAAVLGAGSLKGHTLAAEEINAEGGLLGKRKIETITADEAAGTDANVKEVRRMKLQASIDFFSGVISAGDTVALGPVIEELKLLSVFTDGCTDFLFDKVVPNPKHIFRVTNIQSADAFSVAIATAMTWPHVRRIAHIHPDYAFGRLAHSHFQLAIEKLIPGTQVVSEHWPKLGTPDFSSHITTILAARPDLVVSSLWGGDYVAFYKQSLRFGLYGKAKVATMIAFGISPQALGKDHPEGIIAGAHANYHFTNPPTATWPLNRQFVDRFHKRWNEYPNYAAEGAYTALYLFKAAVEKANRFTGGWPETDQIIAGLEGLSIASPAGFVSIRPHDHSAYKDVVIGFSKNLPQYPFPVWDPDRIITLPVRAVTAPPGWPKPGQGHDDQSAAYNWVKTTWPKVG
jgi:branched-chain amino acid transport system substrate-binding protein